MSQYTPTTDEVRECWATAEVNPDGYTSEGLPVPDEAEQYAEFDRWLEQERTVARREGQAEGMRSTADWLEGGTPRAYGFQHPCDPPGVRGEPSGDERRLLYAVDAIREAADRIENGDRHVDQ